jgi:raffinose/stachyose/melibiose transport system substrate-binding protein
VWASRVHLVSRISGLMVVAAALSFGVGASSARPATKSDTITISMLANYVGQPGYVALIANFERSYPSIKINATYAATTAQLYQQELTLLAAGNAPDILATYPGCGTPISVCTLAKSGYLSPMVKKPWAKRSVPMVTSLDKYGQGLFAFTPIVSLFGVFTNDDLFKKLGLKVPQTFPQLLDVCRKAKAAGTSAVILPGTSAADISSLLTGLAVPTVYAKDKNFLANQKAGKASFGGSTGWHQAFQNFVDMNREGCFQPGAVGTSGASAAAQFARGQGLMLAGITNMKGLIDAGSPQFTFSHYPFPGGTTPNEVRTYVHLSLSPAVNAHSSSENQVAAQKFIDFIARPTQNALFVQIQGGMTQYQFLHAEVTSLMANESSVIKARRYVISPVETWWNAKVTLVMQLNQMGVITGQRSIDDVLNAMDAAWKEGHD